MWEGILLGLTRVMEVQNLLAIVLGTAAGVVVGALPGLTPTMGLALLLPLTFGMPPVPALLALSGMLAGGVYGGAISAILVRIPDPANVPTTLDGYAMTQRGQAAKALGIAAVASTVGGVASAFVLLFFTPPLAAVALRFGPPEIFALAVFGLGIVSSLAGRSVLKGLAVACLGLLVGTVGMDPVSAYTRFTFGFFELQAGFEFVPLLIGTFAVPEILRYAEEAMGPVKLPELVGRMLPTLAEWRRLAVTMIRSGIIGLIIGIAPAAGPVIASYISYDVEKRSSKTPERFGQGAPEGIAGPQTAINACVGGDLVLTFALGIPGSAGAALFIGALYLQGLQPGPLLFQRNADIVYTTFIGFFFVSLAILPLGLIASRLGAWLVLAPKAVLLPFIFAFAVIGSYAVGSSLFDVWVMLIAGLVAYVLQKFDYGAAAFVLALILGPLAEANWNRTMLMAHGDLTFFFQRPIAIVLILLAALMLVAPALVDRFMRRRFAGYEGDA